MKDEQCVRFLQWALPQLQMEWSGFRKVRSQVCKRLARRLRELGLADVDAYRDHLLANDTEWRQIDSMCQVTISRFCRDRGVFGAIGDTVLPELVRGMRQREATTLRLWSAGCGSGEEPYTAALLWAIEVQPRFPGIDLEVVATDVNPTLLARARAGRYAFGTLKELPRDWLRRAFTRQGDAFLIEPEFRRGVRFLQQDIRQTQPAGRFDLVLCRNLVFTYYDHGLQLRLSQRILDRMHEGGALVLGSHESLPGTASGFSPWPGERGIYRRSTSQGSAEQGSE